MERNDAFDVGIEVSIHNLIYNFIFYKNFTNQFKIKK